MAPRTTEFVCTNCGSIQGNWAGQCRSCEEWNSLEERPITGGGGGSASKGKGTAKAIQRGGVGMVAPAKVKKLSDHNPSDFPRIPTGIGELDQVLGGGIVPGSAMLFSGEPGSGKSTLSSMIVDNLAEAGKKVLYVAGEESGAQIRLRTDRMNLKHAADTDVATETEVGAICSTIAGGGYDFAVIDSIQTLYDAELSGAPGSVSIIKQVGEALRRTAKDTGVALLLIGHVTKEGNLAGPRHLEHMVDVVMSLHGERTQTLRILRAEKNRFGSTNEIGVFDMTTKGLVEITDTNTAFLQDHAEQVAGSAICPLVEGTRPLLVEVQALTDPLNNPERPAKRVTQGIDRNRLDMLIAVLNRHAGIPLKLGQRDIFVRLSGGLSKIEEPALDLAVCVALASDVTGRPVKKDVAVFGEVSLKGDVRPVSQPERRVNEASKLGWKTVIGGPRQGTKSVRTLREALRESLEAHAKEDNG